MTENKNKQFTAEMLAELCVEVIDAGKGENIVQLPVTELSVLADYFILCTAQSDPHIKAISERLKREISKKFGKKAKLDGVAASNWIVMDYGQVVIHILSPEMRERYQLESLWSDNPDMEVLEKVSESAPME